MSNIKTTIIGGGCFWCVEAVFELVEGVQKVVSGYAGGAKETANYKAVCSGTTKHAEVVEITFDTDIITYEDLFKIFFMTHDPTTPNQQGNDKGPQYRSVIFYQNEEEKDIATNVINNFTKDIWEAPIVTEVSPLETFYVGEAYHQNYYQQTGDRNSYCTFVITPKVNKFRKLFADKIKK